MRFAPSPSARSGPARWLAVAAVLAGLGLLALPAGGATVPAQAAQDPGVVPGTVHTLTNDPAGNQVLTWARAADGSLTPAEPIATGGQGSGDGLGSQGAVIVSADGRYLFAVNAGSNDVSVLSIRPEGLALLDRVPSGGTRPISITTSGDLLYVLNAGGSGGIAGFRLQSDGHLTALPGAVRPLSGAMTGPAQVQFTPDGRLLIVTEKMTNTIDTFVVGSDGVAGAPMAHPSAGQTPFGFAVDSRGRLFVSEAGPSALSAYAAGADGALTTLTASAVNGQAAACWAVVTEDGRFVYTSNAGTGTISGYTIADDGTVRLLAANGRSGVTGANPTDMALGAGSRYLYALTNETHAIWGFRIEENGSLVPVPGAVALPDGVVGLAAR
jgi:6-phosphogluconolactonase